MKRRKLILSGLMLAGFVLMLLGIIAFLLKKPPGVYAAGNVTPGEDRE